MKKHIHIPRAVTLMLIIFFLIMGVFGMFTAYHRLFKKKPLVELVHQSTQTQTPLNGHINRFERFIKLIEAAHKVRDLENMYLRNEIDNPAVDIDIMHQLIKGLMQEHQRLKRHIKKLRNRAREPMTNKKIKSLRYYLHVLEDCIQDLDIIITNRLNDEHDTDKE